MKGRWTPWVILAVSVAGMVAFSGGLRLIDTVGLLVCGGLAGVALAEVAAARRRKR